MIPHTATLKGSIRTLSPEVQQTVKQRFYALTESIAEGYGAAVSIDYRHEYPVTINDKHQADFLCEVASTVVGEANVVRDADPVMGSEDFAAMLEARPGCYFWVGNSEPAEVSVESAQTPLGDLLVADPCMVHEPTYDFNDKIIPVGASIFVRLVERYLEEVEK